MRKSLLKTPPSELGSRVAPPRAALAAVAEAQKSAARRNGSPYTGVPGMRVAVDEPIAGELPLLAARVRLLEGFVRRSEIADAAQHALAWLGRSLGVAESLCLVRPKGEASLFTVATYGISGPTLSSFSLSLDDWNNPLVAALTSNRQTFFPGARAAADRKRRPSTPLEDHAFHVVPLGANLIKDDPFGLLRVGGDAP